MKHSAELELRFSDHWQRIKHLLDSIVVLPNGLIDFLWNRAWFTGIEDADMTITINGEPGRVHAVCGWKVHVG
jgi:hypothetical protein